jgi:hypothetical protein
LVLYFRMVRLGLWYPECQLHRWIRWDPSFLVLQCRPSNPLVLYFRKDRLYLEHQSSRLNQWDQSFLVLRLRPYFQSDRCYPMDRLDR